MPQTLFINQANNEQYKKRVLTWLQSDFEKKQKPQHHFWHNKDLISERFDDKNAAIILSEEGELVAYMIWKSFGPQAEIDIIEVNEKYRRQGFCKKLLGDFVAHFPNIALLTGSVLPQAEKVFDAMCWESMLYGHPRQMQKKYFKAVKPFLSPQTSLPDGRVIAFFSSVDVLEPNKPSHFYWIKAHKDKLPLKYYQIDLAEDRKLQIPIITTYNRDGYVGVYFNKKLIAEGKAKHLFKNAGRNFYDLLVLDKIDPVQEALFTKVGFFENAAEEKIEEESPESRQARKRKKGARPSFFSDNQAEPNNEKEKPPALKKRKVVSPTLEY